MATPKALRAARFEVNATNAVQVYSDDDHIWFQLRPDVSTEQNIGRPTLKVDVCLHPGTAHKLGLELMNIVDKQSQAGN